MSKAAVRIVTAALAVGLLFAMGRAKAPPKQAQAAVEAEVAAGLKAFKAGKVQDAIAHLQKAISVMQGLLAGDLSSHFPKAPDGWEAGEVKTQALAATGAGSTSFTQARRRYVRKKDKLRVEITLTDSPQLLKAQQAAGKAFDNPAVLQMINQDPNRQVRRIRRDGWTGWSMINKPRKAEAYVFTQHCLLVIDVPKADADVLDTFLKAMDLKGLAKALAESRSAGSE